MRKGIVWGILLGSLLGGAVMFARADVGNFNSYSNGGGWSGSSGSNSSGVYSGRLIVPTYSKDKGWYNAVDKREMDPADWVFILIFGGLFLYGLLLKLLCGPSYCGRRTVYWDNKDSSAYEPMNFTPLANHNDPISLALCNEDPDFSTQAFLAWVKEVFLKLQQAWMNRDWESVRLLESPELYAQHRQQLQEYIDNGRINILERININNAYLFLLRQEKLSEYVAVVLQVRMLDYIIDEHNGTVLKGSSEKDCYLTYLYIFKRARGMKTSNDHAGVQTMACPHCGAPVNVVSAGRCEYCDFVIQVKDHGWVLDDIVGVKPPYANYGPGGVIKYEKKNGGNTYGTYSGR